MAVLGGDVSSVQADRVHSNASMRVMPAQNYTIHELRSATGVVVRKAAQSQNRPGGHSPLIIQHPGLVVELGGHMRSFVGRAYLTDQMPSEVSNQEIR
jgi:hypothetical protein